MDFAPALCLRIFLSLGDVCDELLTSCEAVILTAAIMQKSGLVTLGAVQLDSSKQKDTLSRSHAMLTTPSI